MKFSIRDLFLVTVIVALVLGWWVDRRISSANANKKEAENSSLTLKLGQLERKRELLRIALESYAGEGYANSIEMGGGAIFLPPALPSSSSPAPNPPKP